jgi:ABC-type antimicrobial peptide transport system permease subunit
MIVKLKRISIKPMVVLSTIIYAIAGFLLGLVMAIASVVAPPEEGANLGFWSILVFPLMNAVIGAFSSFMMCLMYNWIASAVGGLEFEAEEIQK